MSNKNIIWSVVAVLILVGGWYYFGVNAPAPADVMTAEEAGMPGIHIMADGSVMLGDGNIVDDANVNDDGNIVLEDGIVVEPVLDLRNASDEEIAEHGMEDMHMEGGSMEMESEGSMHMEEEGGSMEMEGEAMMESES